MELKTHFSAKELSQFALHCLPTSDRRILEKAKRENWQCQKRKGRGGGVEYALASLPAEIQQEIKHKFAISVVEKPKNLPAIRAEVDLANLTDKQRAIADSRMAIVTKVLELEESRMSRIKAVKFFCQLAKKGELPEALLMHVITANAKGNAKRTVGERTLNQWVIDYSKAQNAEQRLKVIAPQVRQPVPIEALNWLPEFLAVYRNTNGVSVAEAYDEFVYRWQTHYADQPLWLDLMPSIKLVTRIFSRLS
ncbi:hypothetical protein RZ64_01865 [[Haemophilus] ducreyi]|nr:DNA-binding protein [[Haemophilus] ducreyi]AKO40803.1 hypothetical protein RZ64_01865 [[Haemophilus] ducreyi]